MLNELNVDCYVSNIHMGIEHMNLAIENLHAGLILRDIVQID